MNRRFFVESAEWQRFKRILEDKQSLFLEAALSAKTMDEKEYNRGWYDAVRTFLAMPDEYLKDDDEKEKDAKEADQEEVAGISTYPGQRPTNFFHA
jgi:hypothetical protein